VNYGRSGGISADARPPLDRQAAAHASDPTDALSSPIRSPDESAMTEPRFDAEPAPSTGDPVLARLTLAWIVPAAAVTVVELLTVGRLTPMVLAADIIAAFLLPFALLGLVVFLVHPGDEPPHDDDDGGGRPPDDLDPPPPSGGFDIDWERFEADVHAHARSRQVAA
jgi:hypothetical protein